MSFTNYPLENRSCKLPLARGSFSLLCVRLNTIELSISELIGVRGCEAFLQKEYPQIPKPDTGDTAEMYNNPHIAYEQPVLTFRWF
jgi:hypothetical protein